MTPKESINNYIQEVGLEEASKFFGKKESTIKTWMKTGTFPGEAYEAYYAALGNAMMQPPPESDPAPMTDSQRIDRIEQFMVQISDWIANQPVAGAAPAGPAGGGPLKPWVEAAPGAPGESNFSSMVRPQATVPNKASFPSALPPPQTVVVQPAGLRPGMTPADTWLNPIKTPKK